MSNKTNIDRAELAKAGLLPLFNSVLRAFLTPAKGNFETTVSFTFKGHDGKAGSVEVSAVPHETPVPKKAKKPAKKKPVEADNGGGGTAAE